jgi:2-methylcitrate dehydratase PrpD
MSAPAQTASERFAAHALGVNARALDAETLSALGNFTRDTLAVGVGGAAAPYAQSARRAALGWTSPGRARLWGGGGAIGSAQAAFINAFQAHCQEFDCVLEAAVLHPMTVVAPVLFAEADAQGLSGETFAAACVAGVDVAGSLGIAATTQIKFFRPATCGLFGAVAALCRARSLSQAQTVDAFGYALAFASGTMQAHVEGTPALAVQVAHAAQSAFQAVDLAQAGLPGPKGAIDGPFGYLTLFETGFDLERAWPSLQPGARLRAVSWKPHPTGRAAHGGIEMALALHAEGVQPETVRSLHFAVTPLIHHLVGRPIVAPLEVNYARLCLPYCAAAALRFGAVSLSHFTPALLNDPETHALAKRVTVAVEANPDAAAFTPQSLTVDLVDGAQRSLRIDALLGTPARPLSSAQQAGKLRDCVAFGFGAPREDVALALEHLTADILALSDVGQVSRAAAGEAP